MSSGSRHVVGCENLAKIIVNARRLQRAADDIAHQGIVERLITASQRPHARHDRQDQEHQEQVGDQAAVCQALDYVAGREAGNARAATFVFLASERAGFITGIDLLVAGGWGDV